jgi:hypothetical protein
MKNLIFLIGFLMTTNAFASTDRVLDGKTITVGGATVTLPTATSTIATTSLTETLTNKTLTSPVINTPTGIVNSDVGLGNVDNTSDATKNAATATLTNKTLTSPVINTPTGIVKGDVGLGNVDNTSDATKNAATATLTNKTIDYNSNTITNLPSAAPAITGSTGSPSLILAVTGITFSGSNYFNIKYIAGNAAPVTVTATPQITAGTLVGQQIILFGESATNTVTLADGNGLSLNGTWVGGLQSALTMVWDGTVWVERARR